MSLYRVAVGWTMFSYYEVEADSEEQANEKGVEACLNDGCLFTEEEYLEGTTKALWSEKQEEVEEEEVAA